MPRRSPLWWQRLLIGRVMTNKSQWLRSSGCQDSQVATALLTDWASRAQQHGSPPLAPNRRASDKHSAALGHPAHDARPRPRVLAAKAARSPAPWDALARGNAPPSSYNQHPLLECIIFFIEQILLGL